MVGPSKVGLFLAAVLVAGAMARPVMAAGGGQQFASADPDVTQTLRLMDQAKAGQVSRQEYLNAMNAQYTRLAMAQYSAAQPAVRTSSSPHR